MYAQIMNGAIMAFDSLPFRVTLADGSTRTSLSELSAAQLAAIDVYPVVGEPPGYDASTQRLTGPALALDGDHVAATWTIERLSAEEVAEILVGAKSAKIAEIQAASNAAIAALEAGYTVGEVQSFEQQRRGAADILAGNTETEDAQYVAALAAARAAAGDSSITALELAGRIAANAAAAAQATIAILGMQQGLEVRARAATTPEELEAIVWSAELSS